MEKSWRRLSARDLNEGEDLSQGGVKIHVFLSPYDVPEGVRGYYDEDAGRFRIDFKYLVDEETTEISRENEPITLIVGRNSKRLKGIKIDVVSLKAESIELKLMVPQIVDKAIKDMEERMGTHNRRRGNYDLTREVIKDHKDEIFSELVPA